MFELRISEQIVEEAELSQKLIKEGFSHAFKAGELIEEARNMLNWKQEREGIMESWLEEHCSEVELKTLQNCMKLYNGGTVKVEATLKGDERTTKEKEVE